LVVLAWHVAAVVSLFVRKPLKTTEQVIFIAAFAPQPDVQVIKQSSLNACIMKTFFPIVWLVFFIPLCAQAQYRSDRPLEMSFEQSEFFFSPSFLNPLGAEHFQRASVLTSDDPLNALERNPANLSDFDRDARVRLSIGDVGAKRCTISLWSILPILQ